MDAGRRRYAPPFSICLLVLAWLCLGGTAQAWVKWQGAAEVPTFDEWAAFSCENSTRFSQVSSPVLQGNQAYRISVQDGDDSYGERCELSQGNTSASNIRRVGGPNVLYHTGDTFWIAFAVFLPTDYTFGCGQPNVNESCDGGLITQEKQLGSCGVPALGTLARRDWFEVRVSGGPECGSDNRLYTIIRTPMVLGRWVKFLRLIHFDIDSDGFYALWVDDDGNSSTNFRSVPPTGTRGTVVGNRVYTHTQKYPTDKPAGSCGNSVPSCSHQRIGIYRDSDVQGPSTAYFDSMTVGHQRAEVINAAFGQ